MYPFFYPACCPMAYSMNMGPFQYIHEEDEIEQYSVEEKTREQTPKDGDIEYVKEYRMMRCSEEDSSREKDGTPAQPPMGGQPGGMGTSGFFQQGTGAMNPSDILRLIQTNYPDIINTIMQGNLPRNQAEGIVRRIIEITLTHSRSL